jgi:FixJ family two-component response regulator
MSHTPVSRGEIFVVEEDAAAREKLSALLQAQGYDVICFADGAALLSLAKTRIPACIFLEVRASGKSGLDILRKLRAAEYPAPIFVTSGEGDIPMAVDAIRSGASDFIEKPFCGTEIVGRVKSAIETLARKLDSADLASKVASLHVPGQEPLSGRECDVLAQLTDGASNKEAALRLGLSARTVEGHRANIMKKIGVKNAAELVRRVLGDIRDR